MITISLSQVCHNDQLGILIEMECNLEKQFSAVNRTRILTNTASLHDDVKYESQKKEQLQGYVKSLEKELSECKKTFAVDRDVLNRSISDFEKKLEEANVSIKSQSEIMAERNNLINEVSCLLSTEFEL